MARTSPVRTVLLILGSIAFVVLGAWVAGLFAAPPSPNRVWAGWLAMIFFCFTGMAGVARLFQERERIVLDDRGFTWRGWSGEHIGWNEVAGIEERKVQGQVMFCVHLRDASRRPSGTLLGKLAGLNRALGFAAITVTATGTDRSAAELREAFLRLGMR